MKGSHTPIRPRSHGSGCRCAGCLGEPDRKKSAAEQLYALLDMRWVRIGTAITYAELARRGIEETFPQQAQQALRYLRERNARLLNNLLADILD